MESVKRIFQSIIRWFRITLSSRTVVVGLVSIGLGVAALVFDIPIQAPPELLITTGLGMIYMREAIAKNGS